MVTEEEARKMTRIEDVIDNKSGDELGFLIGKIADNPFEFLFLTFVLTGRYDDDMPYEIRNKVVNELEIEEVGGVRVDQVCLIEQLALRR